MKHGTWVETLRLMMKPHETGPSKRGGDCRTTLQWSSDPLSHPDLAAMTVTQLADLPFEPRRFSRE